MAARSLLTSRRPKDVFAGDAFSINSLVDISPDISLLETPYSIVSLVYISQRYLCWRPLIVLSVWFISPRDVFAGDPL